MFNMSKDTFLDYCLLMEAGLFFLLWFHRPKYTQSRICLFLLFTCFLKICLNDLRNWIHFRSTKFRSRMSSFEPWSFRIYSWIKKTISHQKLLQEEIFVGVSFCFLFFSFYLMFTTGPQNLLQWLIAPIKYLGSLLFFIFACSSS